MTRHTRRPVVRLLALAGAAGLAMVTVTACARTVDGAGVSLGLAATPSGTGAPTRPVAVPRGPGRHWSAAQLAGRLLPPPAGSRPWHGSWAANVTPSMVEYVDEFYPASSHSIELQILTDEGLTGVAHRTWVAADGHEMDMVLLSFTDDIGARSRYLVASRAKAERSDARPFAVPGGAGVSEAGLDPDGFIRSFVFGLRGNVVVEEFYFAPARPSTSDAVAWAEAQFTRLS